MSREVVESSEEYLDLFLTPNEVGEALRATLLPILEEELAKVEAEVEYLRSVHNGLTGGLEIEASSTISTGFFLDDLLDTLLVP